MQDDKAQDGVTAEPNQVEKPETSLQLNFYNKLTQLDNHNHLFAAFRQVTFDQVLSLFKDDDKYSYFFEIGKTNDAQKTRGLQAKLLLEGWMTEIRIKEHQSVREYGLMLGPYYQLTELTFIYKKLVKKQIDYTIYALQLD